MSPADLLQAYIQSTNLPVSLTYARQMTLTELIQRGVTPEDIRAVVEDTKKQIAQNIKGYTLASLDFRNVLGNADTFEERMLRLRQRKTRSKPIPAQQQATVEVDGSKIVRLVDAQPPEPVRADGVEALRVWRKMNGGAA